MHKAHCERGNERAEKCEHEKDTCRGADEKSRRKILGSCLVLKRFHIS